MSQADLDLIRLGVERRLATVESLIAAKPRWQATSDPDDRPALVRVVAGPTLRQGPRGNRRLGLLVAVAAALGLLLAYGLLGVGGLRNLLPSDATPTPTEVPGALRPLVEPRLTIPVRPRSPWTLVEDSGEVLGLVYFLEDVGSGGYHVGLMIAVPHGVYDPVEEDPLLPLPADLMGWIREHPDLETEAPFELTVAGLPATAIDVTVTYRSDGPKGQTAQFINIGAGPWNLEAPSRKRIVIVELPDGPLLIVFDSRPEFFESGVGPFEDLLARMEFEEPGPAP